MKNGTDNLSAKLSDQISLGTFKADEIINLVVTLEIPITVGNEIKSLEASTNWIFTAEVLEDTNNPQTGDTSNYSLWIILAFISLIFLLVFSKKIKKN